MWKIMDFFMRFFGGFRGKARRALLCLFRPGYVKRSVEQREGGRRLARHQRTAVRVT